MNNDWIDISVAVPAEGFVHWPDNQPFVRKLVMSMAKGDAANVSVASGSVHTGTHMDAPVHFVPGGAGMEAMPLEATIGRARVIAIDDPQQIRAEELRRHDPQAGERILIRTANSGRVWNTDVFQEDFVFLSAEGARYLADCKIRTIGVDYLSVGGYKAGGVAQHAALLGAGVWVIEGLDLQHIEPGAYDLVCLPQKLIGSDGAPARAAVRRIRPER